MAFHVYIISAYQQMLPWTIEDVESCVMRYRRTQFFSAFISSNMQYQGQVLANVLLLCKVESVMCDLDWNQMRNATTWLLKVIKTFFSNS